MAARCFSTRSANAIRRLRPSCSASCSHSASVRSIRRLGDQREIKVDVRLIAATNGDLHRAIAAGTFREDLFYRLATLSIRLPALRDRRSDIPQIAEKLLTLINRQFAAEEPSDSHKSLSASAIAFVKQQPWPGNVRQLSNTLVQAAVLADGVTLSRGDLASALGELPADRAPLTALSGVTLEPGFNLDEYLNAIHRQRRPIVKNFAMTLARLT